MASVSCSRLNPGKGEVAAPAKGSLAHLQAQSQPDAPRFWSCSC